jgi:hypothetical protein
LPLGVTMLLDEPPVAVVLAGIRSKPPVDPVAVEPMPPVVVMPEPAVGVRQAASLDVPVRVPVLVLAPCAVVVLGRVFQLLVPVRALLSVAHPLRLRPRHSPSTPAMGFLPIRYSPSP